MTHQRQRNQRTTRVCTTIRHGTLDRDGEVDALKAKHCQPKEEVVALDAQGGIRRLQLHLREAVAADEDDANEYLQYWLVCNKNKARVQ